MIQSFYMEIQRLWQKEFGKGAREAGHEVELINLAAQLKYVIFIDDLEEKLKKVNKEINNIVEVIMLFMMVGLCKNGYKINLK